MPYKVTFLLPKFQVIIYYASHFVLGKYCHVRIRTGSRISGKGVHMYTGVGCALMTESYESY